MVLILHGRKAQEFAGDHAAEDRKPIQSSAGIPDLSQYMKWVINTVYLVQFGCKKSGGKVGWGEAKKRGQQYEIRRD